MYYSSAYTIFTSGSTYLIALGCLAVVFLYKIDIVGIIKDFFTGKTANNG